MNPPPSPRPPSAAVNDAISHIHTVADATPSRNNAGISQPDFGHGKRDLVMMAAYFEQVRVYRPLKRKDKLVPPLPPPSPNHQ